MDNQDISTRFEEIARLLEMQGEDPFRIRAYRRAAGTIKRLPDSLRVRAQQQTLEELPGIGKTLAREITELVQTGHLRYYDHLKSTVPQGLLPLLRLSSLSTEQIRLLWRKHDVTSMKQLAQMHQQGELPFDEVTVTAIGRDIESWNRNQNRMLLGMALPRAELLMQNLQRFPLVERVCIAGSIRRGVDLVADMNLVLASPDPPRLIEMCTRQHEVRQVLHASERFARILTSEGLRVTFTAVPPADFVPALFHATGSTAHLTVLRRLAQQQGLQLTEHGLTRLRDGSDIELHDEEAIYSHLGLSYIVPELRENTGEIEVAASGHLQPVLSAPDVLGDLHVHSNWGNGAHSIEDIAQAAQRMGYQYIAICDYTFSPETGQGLTAAELSKQIIAIRQLNAQLPPTFKLLAGAEVEITPEGDLTIDDDVLQELDIVVAAMHTGYKAPREQITRRLCKAMEHPLVNVLAHPSGRMLGRQDIPSIDMEAVLETAVDTSTCLEINSHVLRLDLKDQHVRQAKDLGIMLTLGSDAHSVQEMRTMRLGIHTARRGGLEARQLLNALPYTALIRHLQNRDAIHAI
jgi:DNA polymerase (family 10)